MRTQSARVPENFGDNMGWINNSDSIFLPDVHCCAGCSPLSASDWITGVACVAGIDGIIRRTGGHKVNGLDFLTAAFGSSRRGHSGGAVCGTRRRARHIPPLSGHYNLWARLSPTPTCTSSVRAPATRAHGTAWELQGATGTRSRRETPCGGRPTGRTHATYGERGWIGRAAHRRAPRYWDVRGGPWLRLGWSSGDLVDFHAGSWSVATRRRSGSQGGARRRAKAEGVNTPNRRSCSRHPGHRRPGEATGVALHRLPDEWTPVVWSIDRRGLRGTAPRRRDRGPRGRQALASVPVLLRRPMDDAPGRPVCT